MFMAGNPLPHYKKPGNQYHLTPLASQRHSVTASQRHSVTAPKTTPLAISSWVNGANLVCKNTGPLSNTRFLSSCNT
jgi:hypothetical protein